MKFWMIAIAFVMFGCSKDPSVDPVVDTDTGSDTGIAEDTGSGVDTSPFVDSTAVDTTTPETPAKLTPCLERPTNLPTPPGRLPCDLIPPGLTL